MKGSIPAMPASSALDPRLDRAWHALHDAGQIQFQLSPAERRPPPPHWLQALLAAIDRALERALAPVRAVLHWLARFVPDAPWAKILFWAWLAAIVALLGWAIWHRVRQGAWRWPWRRPAAAPDTEIDLPGADTPHTPAWLIEADRLAAEGRYAEALHSLLLRCVQDVARRRPQLVRPSLTARDLARAEEIPGPARALFAEIAAAVEASLWGGRPVAQGDWQRGRDAYQGFAQAWRRRA